MCSRINLSLVRDRASVVTRFASSHSQSAHEKVRGVKLLRNRIFISVVAKLLGGVPFSLKALGPPLGVTKRCGRAPPQLALVELESPP